jgi:hypothetical protein
LRSSGTLQAAVTIPTQVGFAALQNVPLRAATSSIPAQSAASRQAVLNQLGFLGGAYAQGPIFSNLQNITVNGTPIQFGTTNFGVSQPNDTNNFITRVDHRLGEKDNFTIRYISNKSNDANLTSNLTFGELFSADQLLYDQNLALSETHVFSSSVVNEFRSSYIRRNLDFPERDTTTLTTNITGLFGFGGLGNFPRAAYPTITSSPTR